MSGLLIIGAGGHGKVVADIASAMGKWGEIAFVDDKFPEMKSLLEWPVIGRISEFAKFRQQYPDVFVAVGDNSLRREITTQVEKERLEMPVLIHPRAAVSRFAAIGPGTVVITLAAVNASAIIGKGSIINTGATVGHDCVLGDFVHIAPGASIAGEAIIGEGTWVGMRAGVVEQVKVGAWVIVGAGAVIINDVPACKLIVGIPGRIVRNISKDDLAFETREEVWNVTEGGQ